MKYGRYKIVNELGKGAMGVVYKAHDPRIDREIALKVLRQDRVASEDFRQRFLKEAKAIGRLSHPNIVTVFDVGQDHETVFIAMELLEGMPLNEMTEGERLSVEKIVDISAQIAGALDYAHTRGIVHRDIKPTNIIITPEGKVKLTDFGIARFEDPTATQQTQAGEILGTPSYMSAEQVMGKTIDKRSDLYSLGVILYELCIGDRPFKGANLSAVFMAITQETPVPPIKANPSVSPSLSDLIMKSLSKKPEDRFQTGKEMEEALRNNLKDTMSQEMPDKTIIVDDQMIIPDRYDEKKSPKIGLFALVSMIVIILAVGWYFYIDKKEPVPPVPIIKSTVDTTVPVAIKEKYGVLNLTSQPDGAHIFINGKFQGKTPLPLKMVLGKYEVRASLPNYSDWEGQFTLKKEGQEISFPIRLAAGINN